MALGKFTKSSGMAALAAGLVLLALPGGAQAQERGHGRWGGGGGATVQNGGGDAAQGGGWRGRGDGGGWRGRGDAGGNWQGGGRSFRSEQAAPQAQVPVQPQRNWSRGDGNANGRWGGWRGRDAGPLQAQPVPAPQVQRERRNWSGNGGWQGRTGDTGDRFVGRRDEGARWRSDNSGWRNDNNTWRGDNAWRGTRQGFARNSDTWRDGWRRDGRYDWRSYRSAHRDVYRLRPYYAPYRGYSYRRLGVGVYLDSLFFGSRYWIDDPWSYRLPPADGPYRWVRYYDDALLVDTYTGEVVDVIYDFFW